MQHRTRVFVVCFILAGWASQLTAATSPYAGEQARAIKSLDPGEVAALRSGKGMGFAKAAELNHYPGPRHVLDLAQDLRLSTTQVEQTRAIFRRMEAEAIRLGDALVELETELDAMFASQQVPENELQALLLEIGRVRAELRGTHLRAHVAMKDVLSKHQIAMYDALRGYSGGKPSHSHAH